MNIHPFRLLDLPQEIQDQIYAKYYEGVDLVLRKCERRDSIIFTSAISFKPLPNLIIEQTCRKVLTDSRRVRHNIWSRKLTIARLLGVKPWINPLASDIKFAWLRQLVEKLDFEGEKLGTVLNSGVEELIQQFTNLRQIRFTFNEYPGIINNDSQLARALRLIKTDVGATPQIETLGMQGIKQIASLLLNQHGSKTCVKVTRITYYTHSVMFKPCVLAGLPRRTFTITHNFNVNHDSDTIELESRKTDPAEVLPTVLERLASRPQTSLGCTGNCLLNSTGSTTWLLCDGRWATSTG